MECQATPRAEDIEIAHQRRRIGWGVDRTGWARPTQKKKRNTIEPGTAGAADDRPSLRQRQDNSAAPSRGAAAAAAPAASTRRVPDARRSRAIVPH